MECSRWVALAVLIQLAVGCSGAERIHALGEDLDRIFPLEQPLRIHQDRDGARRGPRAAGAVMTAGREHNPWDSGLALGSDAALRSEHWHGDYRVAGGLGRRKALQLLDNSSWPLAVRGDRPDPLDKLRHYRGGFNVKNKHYWASVVFTGIIVLSLGAVWILVGIVVILWRKRLLGKRAAATGLPAVQCVGALFLAACLALLSIALLGMLLHDNMNFQKDMRRVEGIINTTTETATLAVTDITSHLSALMQVNTSSLGISLQDNGVSSDLNDINKEAHSVQHRVAQVLKIMRKVLKPMNIGVYVIAAAEVALLFVGLVLAVLLFRFRKVGHALVWVTLICWLFTLLVWLSSAMYLVIDNVAADVCTTVKEYQQHPESTTLEAILPCRKLQQVSIEGISQLKQELSIIVSGVNSGFGIAQSLLGTDLVAGASFVTVCDPFANANDSTLSLTTMTPSCPPNTVPIEDFPEVLAPYVCQDRDPDPTACTSRQQTITEEQYNATVLLCSRLQTVVTDDIPAIQVVAQCSFVLDAFSAIQQQCPSVKSALRSIWILFLTLAVISALAILGWLLAVWRSHGVPRWASVIDADGSSIFDIDDSQPQPSKKTLSLSRHDQSSADHSHGDDELV